MSSKRLTPLTVSWPVSVAWSEPESSTHVSGEGSCAGASSVVPIRAVQLLDLAGAERARVHRDLVDRSRETLSCAAAARADL
jgi:hypothetical protein